MRAALGEPLATPHHSITSSARPESGSGTAMPSALAVLRLRISSTFVDCTTGRSAGFSPYGRAAAIGDMELGDGLSRDRWMRNGCWMPGWSTGT
jgi:hypothetical protein